MNRFCIIKDDSGHAYLCPLERRDEAIHILSEIENFWYSDDVEEAPPDIPDYLISTEISRLSFSDPIEF